MIQLVTVFLAASPPVLERSVGDLLWLFASAILMGLVVLIGFMAVHRRFMNHEFPAVIKSLEGQQATLEKIREGLHSLEILMAEQSAELRHHDSRINRLERDADEGASKP